MMTDTTGLAEFYLLNNTDLTRYMTSKVYSSAAVPDVVQNFYLNCATHDSLAKWDCSRSSYSTYICHLANWQLPRKEPVTQEVTEDMPASVPAFSVDLSMRVFSFARYIQAHGGEHTRALLLHMHNRVHGKAKTDPPYVKIKYLALLRRFRSAERAGL